MCLNRWIQEGNVPIFFFFVTAHLCLCFRRCQIRLNEVDI